MDLHKLTEHKKTLLFTAIFIIVNIAGIFFISIHESNAIDKYLIEEATDTRDDFNNVLADYKHSFQIFTEMLSREIENNPDPDQIWNYLKTIDTKMLDIEGDTFDGLYMYYKGRYLYSWDTPYAEYEKTGYVATERPWYKDAAAGEGKIVFTPPYMSYANHYILSTISQLQPDKETVFAYDIKMGNIQDLIHSMNRFKGEQVILYNQNGTIFGTTPVAYVGSSFHDSIPEAKARIDEAKRELAAIDENDDDEIEKAKEKIASATSFYNFRESFKDNLSLLAKSSDKAHSITIDGSRYYGYLLQEDDYSFLVLIPFLSMLKATLGNWLVPLLLIELLLIYILNQISRALKNRELKEAYVELGQTQKRLQIALKAAQKEAAIDELTGMMNFSSFKKNMTKILTEMEPDDSGIFIMIDGDHFKQVNDNYGHNIGDEVIKLTAQMIVGRIRTIDIASRLHGDEFAIFVADTDDYSVAQRIMKDINQTLAKEAAKRNMPAITLSAGAVLAKQGDTYVALSKAADVALYRAKETHDGGFAHE